MHPLKRGIMVVLEMFMQPDFSPAIPIMMPIIPFPSWSDLCHEACKTLSADDDYAPNEWKPLPPMQNIHFIVPLSSHSPIPQFVCAIHLS